MTLSDSSQTTDFTARRYARYMLCCVSVRPSVTSRSRTGSSTETAKIKLIRKQGLYGTPLIITQLVFNVSNMQQLGLSCRPTSILVHLTVFKWTYQTTPLASYWMAYTV